MLFQFRGVADEILRRDDWRILREWVGEAGDIDRHIEDLARPGALTAALNWYRANIPPESLLREQHSYPKIQTPTMLVWAKLDPTRSEDAMVGSLDHVEGQPRYECFENTGHWIQLERPKELNALLIEFLTGPNAFKPH